MTDLDPDKERARIVASRNRVMALLLGGMALLFFLITLARLGGN
ncbi:MAG: hypothetical protein ACREBO_01955 [Novosphingobium sp.]